MNKINADPVNLNKVQSRIAEEIIANHTIIAGWHDVGIGESFNRAALAKHFGIEPVTYEKDLDVAPYPKSWTGRFNTVTSLEVLEHLYNPLFHLGEVNRILAEGGSLIMTTPNDYSLIYKAEHLLSRKYRPHFHQFSERDLRDVLQRAGFKHISIRKFRRSGLNSHISPNGLMATAQKISKFSSSDE